MVFTNKGLSKMLIIIALAGVILLAGIGVVGTKMLGGKKGGAHAAKEKVPTTELALGEFVVNLADTSQIRYLKTDLVLVVEGKAEAGGEGGEGGEGGGKNSRIRDAVIGVLSGKRFADLVRPGGKDVLKKDILVAVNERMEETKAVDVYFNEFAMQ